MQRTHATNGSTSPRVVFESWRIVRRLPDSAARIHVTTRDRDSRFDDLYTVEPDGHGKRMERRNPGHVSNWIVDTNDRIRARVVNAGPGAFTIEFDEDGDDEDWRSVFTFEAALSLQLLSAARKTAKS